MRRGLMLATAGVLVLAACQEAPGRGEAVRADAAADAAVEMTLVAPGENRVARAEVPAAPADAESANDAGRMREAPMFDPRAASPLAPVASIAYSYGYALSAPRDRGAELMSRHELTCAAAGPGFCQVVSAQADWTSRDPAGRLELRGQPQWIDRFRANLALDAQNAGGRLDTAVTDGEDLTRPIDQNTTEAATSAGLIERIQVLRARSGGTLAQKLEVERELGQLQRQYDAQQLALREMNDRVTSARLTIDYREGGAMGADSPTRPVSRALADAFGLSMSVVAVLITLGSVMLPVAGVAAVTWWALKGRRRKVAA